MPTQKDVAAHLDLSDRRVRDLLKEGILPPSRGKGGYDLDACRVGYIQYLRGLATKQVDHGEDDYTALLEMEKHRRMKRENDEAEGLVAPVDKITEALEKVGAAMIPILESMPLEMKRLWPEITGDQVRHMQVAIARCRNTIADIEIDL